MSGLFINKGSENSSQGLRYYWPALAVTILSHLKTAAGYKQAERFGRRELLRVQGLQKIGYTG